MLSDKIPQISVETLDDMTSKIMAVYDSNPDFLFLELANALQNLLNTAGISVAAS